MLSVSKADTESMYIKEIANLKTGISNIRTKLFPSKEEVQTVNSN
jgi:hypothetical protein